MDEYRFNLDILRDMYCKGYNVCLLGGFINIHNEIFRYVRSYITKMIFLIHIQLGNMKDILKMKLLIDNINIINC